MTVPASPVELPQLPKPHALITGKLGDMLLFTSTVARKRDAVYLDAETLNFGQQCYEAGVRAGQASLWKPLTEDPNIQDPEPFF